MSQIWFQSISHQPLFLPSVLLLSSSESKIRPDGLGTLICKQDADARAWNSSSSINRKITGRRFTKTWCDSGRDEAQISECSSSISSSSRLFLDLSIPTTNTCSITKAFTSMVFMLRSLQSSALQMRQLISCEADFQSLLASVQMDMHCSFLWLFQQVFANTPRLMISLIIILANFLAFSTSNLKDQQQPIPNSAASSPENHQASKHVQRTESSRSQSADDGSSAHDVFISGNFTAGLSDEHVVNEEEEGLLMVSLLEQAAEQHKADNNGRAPHIVEVVPAAELVAPVSVQIEADDYECFDRTELLYQDALSFDRQNPLLLGNYAEFMFLVRRDYERAHDLFHLALTADPEDAEIISRYAKFVWLVKGDKRVAEEAYRAAMAAEPSNPFYAGCYAHFLWHSSEEQAASRLIGSSVRDQA